MQLVVSEQLLNTVSGRHTNHSNQKDFKTLNMNVNVYFFEGVSFLVLHCCLLR